MSHPFLGASLDSIATNMDKLETWGVEIKCPSSKLDQSINDVFKDRKFYLERANGKIQLKRSHKYFYQIQGQVFCTQSKRVDFVVYFEKKCTTVCSDCNAWWKFLATNFTTNWVFLQKGCCSWIVHPQISKRWKIVSTWWLEEKFKKKETAILIATLHKKHYFRHEYLLNGELVGINYLRFFMFYGTYMNLN